jgi:hypothetical protein
MVAELIDQVLSSPEDDFILQSARGKVDNLSAGFPIFG